MSAHASALPLGLSRSSPDGLPVQPGLHCSTGRLRRTGGTLPRLGHSSRFADVPVVSTPEPRVDERELLIREARERQRRRRIGATATVAVASAAAIAIYSVATAGTSRATASSNLGRIAATGACDRSAGWQLKQGMPWSEPTGQHTDAIRLLRSGPTACLLRGYPTVVLRDSRGRTIPFRYTHHGDTVVSGRAPKSVRVSAHGAAFFVFNKYRCDARATRIARWLVVRLPGVHGAVRLRMPHYPIIDYCTGGGPSATVAVSPIVSRMAQAAAAHP